MSLIIEVEEDNSHKVQSVLESDSGNHSNNSTILDNETDFQNCRETFLDKFENLANQLAAGWKYHIANTDGVKEAWVNFEDFYTEICSLGIGTGRLFHPVPSGNWQHSIDNDLISGQHHQLDERQRTPERCQRLLMEKVGALAVKLSPNWLFAISNVEGISQTWKEFERYFHQICVLDRGKLVSGLFKSLQFSSVRLSSIHF